MAAMLLGALLARRRLRRERIFRDRTTPLDTFSDTELIQRNRLNRTSIMLLVDVIGEQLEKATDRSLSISPTLQVLLALRFYASGTFQSLIGDLHGVSVSSVSRTINKVSKVIAGSQHQCLAIAFPGTPDEISRVKFDFCEIANFPNVIGCIDGTQIAIRTPYQHEPIFVCRKGFHSLNIQATCDAQLRFTSVCAKFPGSAHDAYILQQSGIPLKMAEFEECVILGDSGYPLKTWLMVPFGNPATLGEERYNKALSSTRCSIERAFGVAKSRFRCIYHKSGGCLMYSPDVSAQIITAVFRLHNFCINQRLPDLVIEPDDEAQDTSVYTGLVNDGKTIRDRLVQHRFS